MIHTFTQGQIGKSHPSGYRLDTVNLCAGLAPSSFTAQSPFFAFTAGNCNNGVLLTSGNEAGTRFILTTDASQANNNGCGVQIVFGSAKRVGRIKLSRYGTSSGAICDFKVQAIVGGTPTDVGTVSNISTGYTLMDIDCNSSYTYSETTWNVRITNWSASSTSNMYMGEIEAYEWVQ
tara:strand:+ start:84 stop:614 length:531 start_codon:yes stop_codon:yes gene_type:complete